MSKFQINFKGNKEDIHQQLKQWCEEEGANMNGTIISLIKKHLSKTYDKK